MGRHKKYKNGISLLSVSIDSDVDELLDISSRQIGKTKSELVCWILKHYAMSQEGFCRMMARKAAQDAAYWQARGELINENSEIFKLPKIIKRVYSTEIT